AARPRAAPALPPVALPSSPALLPPVLAPPAALAAFLLPVLARALAALAGVALATLRIITPTKQKNLKNPYRVVHDEAI
ncbi:N utilization substance protein B, partial [Acinetobacter baumannii]